jgi:ribonuclease P protein component
MVAAVACSPWAEGATAMATIGDRPCLTAPKKAARFPRSVRLLRHADFERVYKQGRRQFSRLMTVFYLGRAEERNAASRVARTPSSATPAPRGPRIGFAVGRVFGGAVERNRMKRRLREAVRLLLPAASIDADVVIHPKKVLLTAGFAEILNDVQRAFAKIERELSNHLAGNTRADATGRKDEPS